MESTVALSFLECASVVEEPGFKSTPNIGGAFQSIKLFSGAYALQFNAYMRRFSDFILAVSIVVQTQERERYSLNIYKCFEFRFAFVTLISDPFTLCCLLVLADSLISVLDPIESAKSQNT